MKMEGKSMQSQRDHTNEILREYAKVSNEKIRCSELKVNWLKY